MVRGFTHRRLRLQRPTLQPMPTAAWKDSVRFSTSDYISQGTGRRPGKICMGRRSASFSRCTSRTSNFPNLASRLRLLVLSTGTVVFHQVQEELAALLGNLIVRHKWHFSPGDLRTRGERRSNPQSCVSFCKAIRELNSVAQSAHGRLWYCQVNWPTAISPNTGGILSRISFNSCLEGAMRQSTSLSLRSNSMSSGK